MNSVSLSAIEDAWHEIYDTTEERTHELLDAFKHEQPELVLYLSEAESEISKLDDRGYLLLYGLWAWFAFKLNGRDNSMVSASTIEAAANRNHADMQRMEQSQQSLIMDTSQDFRKDFHQLPMLGAIINDVMEGQMEGESRQDDITGMIVLCAKTVIDCLDA